MYYRLEQSIVYPLIKLVEFSRGCFLAFALNPAASAVLNLLSTQRTAMIKASLIASLLSPPSSSGDEIRALPDSVEWLEVRSDLVGDLDPDWLRNHFKGRLLYSLRSQAEGGNYSDSTSQRHRRLETASHFHDRVELEGSRDFSGALLARIAPESAVCPGMAQPVIYRNSKLDSSNCLQWRLPSIKW